MTTILRSNRASSPALQLLAPDESTRATSADGRFVEGVAYDMLTHFERPVSRANVSIADRFRQEVETWLDATLHVSNYVEKFLHPSYQRIIGMGPLVLPFILSDLKESPRHWFWALQSITGANPVPPEHAGRVEKMRDDWLRWASDRGIF